MNGTMTTGHRGRPRQPRASNSPPPLDPNPKNPNGAAYSVSPGIWGIPIPNSYGVNMHLFPYVVAPGETCSGECKDATKWFANNQARTLASMAFPLGPF